MILGMMRHGHYEASGTNPWLSAQGKVQVLAVASALGTHAVPIERVLVSPALRAQETADLVMYTLGLSPSQVQPCPALHWDSHWSVAAAELVALAAGSACLCIGHEPLIRDWVAHWPNLSRYELGGLAYASAVLAVPMPGPEPMLLTPSLVHKDRVIARQLHSRVTAA